MRYLDTAVDILLHVALYGLFILPFLIGFSVIWIVTTNAIAAVLTGIFFEIAFYVFIAAVK